MSYDIDVVSEECPTCRCTPERLEWNYTSNMSAVWRAAGADLAEFHGKFASECVPVLRAAIADIEENWARYTKMDPPNGWGSVETLLPALQHLLQNFEARPSGVVNVSC